MRRLHRLSRRRLAAAIGAIIILLAIGGALLYRHETELPKGHGGTPPPVRAELTADERAYYEYVGPRLHNLVGETQVLAQLGSQKSRNLIVLEKGYNQTTQLIQQIQGYEKTHPVPARFMPAHTQMTSGIATIEQTMSKAQSAFLHFHFDQLKPLIAVFEHGSSQLAQAASSLDRAGGGHLSTGGTPSPSAQ